MCISRQSVQQNVYTFAFTNSWVVEWLSVSYAIRCDGYVIIWVMNIFILIILSRSCGQLRYSFFGAYSHPIYTHRNSRIINHLSKLETYSSIECLHKTNQYLLHRVSSQIVSIITFLLCIFFMLLMVSHGGGSIVNHLSKFKAGISPGTYIGVFVT
jgi:hypothetical protein